LIASLVVCRGYQQSILTAWRSPPYMIRYHGEEELEGDEVVD
jgi:hypothetical protein